MKKLVFKKAVNGFMEDETKTFRLVKENNKIYALALFEDGTYHRILEQIICQGLKTYKDMINQLQFFINEEYFDLFVTYDLSRVY